MMEEFEVVGSKKNRFAFSDSESDDSRIPNFLLVKLNPVKQGLNSILVQALKLVPESAQSAIVQEDLKAIFKLLTSKKLKNSGGWEHPNELSVTCMHVGRD